MLDHTLKSDVTARRPEVIAETGRRRWFSKDDKARIVEETLVPGAVVSEIALRHGLTPQQVFTWRRQARQLLTPMADDPPFVPAVVDAMCPPWRLAMSARQRDARPSRMSGLAVAMPGASRSKPKASRSGLAEGQTRR
jgi:transposase